MDGGDSADGFRLVMECYRAGDVDITDTVTVGKKKAVIRTQVLLDSVNTFSSERILTGIRKSHLPIFFRMPGMELRFRIAPQIKSSVAGIPQVVPEIFLDHLS